MDQPDPLQEAADPSTDPERLGQLAGHKAVQRVAWRNPSLPEEVWREVLLDGHPEAWANPMAPFYVLTWTPRKEDWGTLEEAVRFATQALWEAPSRCSPEGKALIAAKIQEGWITSASGRNLMQFLGWWAKAKGDGSSEHLKVVHIAVLCVRTVPDLTDKGRQVLDLLEAWTAGGEDRRYEAYTLAFSNPIKEIVGFARDPSYSPWYAINQVVHVVASDKEGATAEEAQVQHDRLLADLIRREMPLPPVVE
jgi:hypothetical protein